MSSEKKAIFAAGCFWGVEAFFQKIEGVIDTRVGYIGGDTSYPNYDIVCQGQTNHAEAVEIRFNERIVSYSQLLIYFWQVHNPTQLNRQGVDVGAQYRSAIFYLDEEQKQQAEEAKIAAQANYNQSIVTEIIPATTFWQAEEYHQNYVRKRQLFFQ